MMYNNKMAIAIKSNGKVLREFGDTVKLPVGSEYSIFLKNMNSVRAKVDISIDGVDVTEGMGLVVNANESLDIERFIKNGNTKEGNRFKFIERTAKIEDGPRGIKVEDGLIRVAFKFEKRAPKVIEETVIKKTIHKDEYYPSYPYYYPYYPHYPKPYWNGYAWITTTPLTTTWTTTSTETPTSYTLNAAGKHQLFNGDPTGKLSGVGQSITGGAGGGISNGFGSGSVTCSSIGGSASVMNCSVNSATPTMDSTSAYVSQVSPDLLNGGSATEVKTSGIMRGMGAPIVPVQEQVTGITVPGSISNQQFTVVKDFECEQEEFVVVLKLVGFIGEEPVSKPVTVKSKKTCPTCGHRNKGTAKWCNECPTNIEKV